MSGATNFHAGMVAEDQVAAEYQRRCQKTCQRRWRGQGGEIDLIVEQDDGLIFVEVKRHAILPAPPNVSTAAKCSEFTIQPVNIWPACQWA
jgi:Holliday junction resolvase-like predicted endonuclease